MARKESYVTISDEGRDKGKVFRLTEMNSTPGEKWAIRALLAVARNGVDIDDSVLRSGFQGIAYVGLKALTKIRFEDAEPLLDEMWDTCVRICPNTTDRSVVRGIIESDVKEIWTRLMLRWEAIKLHVDFFPQGDQSAPSTSQTNSTTSPLPNIPTSPQASEPRYHPAKRRRPSLARSSA